MRVLEETAFDHAYDGICFFAAMFFTCMYRRRLHVWAGLRFPFCCILAFRLYKTV